MTRLLGRLAAMSPARARPAFVEHLDETITTARASTVSGTTKQWRKAQRLAGADQVAADG
jgi:hypothetical protein